jgi:hypothetical protein
MNPDTAREDLAFLRALVQPDDAWQRKFGETYAAGGLCYGIQMILHGLQQFGLVAAEGPTALLVGFGPSVAFLALLVVIHWGSRTNGSAGVTSRAMSAVFGTIGLTNFAMVAIFASIAIREQSIKIWLIYAPVVLVMQGAAWLAAFMLRRKPWFAVVAIGWFVTGISMAAVIDSLGWYILVGGVGFVAFMLAPGLMMMRQARAA